MPSVSFAASYYFSPDDDIQSVIINNARMANQSLIMSMYGFHLPSLRDIFIAKNQQGVKVQLLLDHTQAEGVAEKPDVEKLIAAKVDVVIGTSPEHHAILHSKYLLVDSQTTLTGSYNFSLSAAREDNTMSAIRSPELVAKYLVHFNKARAWILAHEPQYQSN